MNVKKGDFCKVLKSKYIVAGSVVEILDEIVEGIFLCGTTNRENYIVVAENLQTIKEV